MSYIGDRKPYCFAHYFIGNISCPVEECVFHDSCINCSALVRPFDETVTKKIDTIVAPFAEYLNLQGNPMIFDYFVKIGRRWKTLLKPIKNGEFFEWYVCTYRIQDLFYTPYRYTKIYAFLPSDVSSRILLYIGEKMKILNLETQPVPLKFDLLKGYDRILIIDSVEKVDIFYDEFEREMKAGAFAESFDVSRQKIAKYLWSH